MTVDPEELRSRRRRALLAKWSAAKRLSPDELAEIADLLPQAPAPAPPAVELTLEAQVEGHSDRKYAEGRAAYAARYGQAPRTINRWMAKDAPLDEPRKMPAWWAAHYKQRVPPNLLALAAGPDPAPPASSDSEKTHLLPGLPIEAASLTSLQQARRVADLAYARLERAQGANDAGELALAQRAHKDASEQLRRMELAEPKIRAAAGKVVDREKLRVFLTELHTSIALTLRSLCRRVRAELANKTAAEQEALWQAELDKLFAGFRNCEFADPVA